jgi:two-component system, cell cycle sensor histidine kinase and response regulator CckA
MTQPENSFETILVVEDDANILKLVSARLRSAGYRVLPASSSAHAIKAASITKGKIHLLLSDVMMPDMSGPDVAHLLQKHRPELRVMLMSGFPGDMLFLHHGWHFIEKPFVPTHEHSQGDDLFRTRIRSQATAA